MEHLIALAKLLIKDCDGNNDLEMHTNIWPPPKNI